MNCIFHIVFFLVLLTFILIFIIFIIRVTSSIKSVSLTGSSSNTLLHSKEHNEKESDNKPVLIEPEVKDQEFIDLAYELNPLNSEYNKRFKLKSRSLKIIYHAVTINNIVYFFRSSEVMQQKK